jgi:hypothetical protein
MYNSAKPFFWCSKTLVVLGALLVCVAPRAAWRDVATELGKVQQLFLLVGHGVPKNGAPHATHILLRLPLRVIAPAVVAVATRPKRQQRNIKEIIKEKKKKRRRERTRV